MKLNIFDCPHQWYKLLEQPGLKIQSTWEAKASNVVSHSLTTPLTLREVITEGCKPIKFCAFYKACTHRGQAYCSPCHACINYKGFYTMIHVRITSQPAAVSQACSTKWHRIFPIWTGAQALYERIFKVKSRKSCLF